MHPEIISDAARWFRVRDLINYLTGLFPVGSEVFLHSSSFLFIIFVQVIPPFAHGIESSIPDPANEVPGVGNRENTDKHYAEDDEW